jgi:hypothetical protein
MEGLNKLRESFKAAAHAGGPLALHDATVLAVDTESFTCDIEMDGVQLPDVRLRAVVSENNSIDILPAINSAVIVGQLGDDDFIVLAFDEITSWRVTTGDTVMGLNSTGVQISKGDESLNKILTDLVKAVLTIAAAKDAASLTLLLTRIKTLLK